MAAATTGVYYDVSVSLVSDVTGMGGGDVVGDWMKTALLAVLLFGLSLVTSIGNAMVLHAVRTDKRLQTVSNMFIVSLAIADLIVGVIVMPISAAYILLGQWPFGIAVCQLWIGVDYTASTASILNLLVLSMDRYWSVTSPLQYLHRRTSHRALVMISIAWCLSVLWLVPIVGWHHFANDGVRTVPADVCDTEYATNTPLKLVTAFVNFYVPLLIMFGLYTKVFVEIRKRSKLEITQARNACMPSAGGGGGHFGGQGHGQGRNSVSETGLDELGESSAYDTTTDVGGGTDGGGGSVTRGPGSFTRSALLQSIKTLNVVSLSEQRRRAPLQRQSSQFTSLPVTEVHDDDGCLDNGDSCEPSPCRRVGSGGCREELIPLTSSAGRKESGKVKDAADAVSRSSSRRFYSISFGEDEFSANSSSGVEGSSCGDKVSSKAKRALLRQSAVQAEEHSAPARFSGSGSGVNKRGGVTVKAAIPPLAVQEDSGVTLSQAELSSAAPGISLSPLRLSTDNILSPSSLTNGGSLGLGAQLGLRMVATLSGLSAHSVDDGRLAIRDVVNHFRSIGTSPAPSTRNIHGNDSTTTAGVALLPSRAGSRRSSPLIDGIGGVTTRSVRFDNSLDNGSMTGGNGCNSIRNNSDCNLPVSYPPLNDYDEVPSFLAKDFALSRISRAIRGRRRRRHKKPKSALLRQAKRWRRKIERHRLRLSASLAMEIKAAKQLGVIMGAFTICFLPYFICFIIVPFCRTCVPDELMTVVTWFGYLNSTFNPVLYPLCNSNFRRRFYQMLHSPITLLRRGSS